MVISQLNWAKITSKSFELGLRCRVGHFVVSQPIRLILENKSVPRVLLSIACFPGNQAQIELI